MRLLFFAFSASLTLCPTVFSSQNDSVLRKTVRPLGAGAVVACEITLTEPGKATVIRTRVTGTLKTLDTRDFSIAYGDIVKMISECAAQPSPGNRSTPAYPSPGAKRSTYEARERNWFVLSEKSPVNEKLLPGNSAGELIELLDRYCD